MAQAYQTVNSLQKKFKPGLHETWTLRVKFFLTILIVWGSLSKKLFSSA